jgi:hypothetical protein
MKARAQGAAFLLNLQDDMLEDLATRVVAPPGHRNVMCLQIDQLSFSE